MSDSLEEVYRASQPLLVSVADNQEEVEDFVRALRFMIRANGDTGSVFLQGFEKLLLYQENLQCIAVSYHRAVGAVVDRHFFSKTPE